MVLPPCTRAPCLHVAEDRARDAEEVDAPVRVELAVLDGDERVDGT